MPSKLSLWWSLTWRSFLLMVLLVFALGWVADGLLGGMSTAALARWRPSVLWVLMGGVTGLLGVLPGVLPRLIWGRRLGLSDLQWRIAGVALGLFFVVLACVGYLTAATSTPEAALTFRLLVPLPGFLVAMALIARAVHRRAPR